MTTSETHTFPNGVTVDRRAVAEAAFNWMTAWTADMLYGKFVKRPTLESAVDALVLATLSTLHTNSVTGGVPWGAFLLLDEHRGASVAPNDPARGDPTDWGTMARAIYAQEVLAHAQARGFRYAVNIGSTWGGVQVTEDPADMNKVVRVRDDEPPEMLVRFTATDLETGDVVRWWAKASGTGDDEKPLRLLPVTAQHDEEWDFMKALDESSRESGLIHLALPPGIEHLTMSEPLAGEVDVRPGVYLPWMVDLIGQGADAVRAAMAEACVDLDVTMQELGRTIERWTPKGIQRAMRGEAPDGFDDLPMGRGMKA
jgi:hypothetical protein